MSDAFAARIPDDMMPDTPWPDDEPDVDLDFLAEPVMRIIHAYYQLPGCNTGGNLHIALEDSNMNDRALGFCLDECVKYHDAAGFAVALMLLSLPEVLRDHVWESLWADGANPFNAVVEGWRWDGGDRFDGR